MTPLIKYNPKPRSMLIGGTSIKFNLGGLWAVFPSEFEREGGKSSGRPGLSVSMRLAQFGIDAGTTAQETAAQQMCKNRKED